MSPCRSWVLGFFCHILQPQNCALHIVFRIFRPSLFALFWLFLPFLKCRNQCHFHQQKQGFQRELSLFFQEILRVPFHSAPCRETLFFIRNFETLKGKKNGRRCHMKMICNLPQIMIRIFFNILN